MSDYDPKIVHLPGTRLTPEVVLHRTLQKIDRIKGVVVIIQWDDDSWDVDWSQMNAGDLVVASKVLDLEAGDQMRKLAEERTDAGS